MLSRRSFNLFTMSVGATGLAGCGTGSIVALPDMSVGKPRPQTRTLARPNYAEVYTAYPGERFAVPAVNSGDIDPEYLRQTVEFRRDQAPGSIVIDPASYHLYFVESPGIATRYGVGVGREGFGWSGAAKINMKRDWPDWVPPHEMVERDPEIKAKLERTPRGLGVLGGPKSPLGARAMYLFDGTGDLGYRIHGTLEPYTVGTNVSSGCIRMINQDIIHLYARVSLGTPVTVLPA
ncbi:L,D-transpeptidase [Bosea sp. 685]|uniref:L,D-transpeptidase n=1 Tax=Bosea sp. 685 TaxID=3080057 RepID=UPI002893092A|nr:L,D-transpeptidase [Bosea sp. 685]WNJ88394.1 L,D-transpeptidase [Bosea sp. 685]